MQDKQEIIRALKEKALDTRKKLLKLSNVSGPIHIGGDLSMADMMTALYSYKLNIDRKDPEWPDRDRFILSKGHGSGCWYLAMAEGTEWFEADEVINTYDKFKTRFTTHPDRNKAPGVEMTSGSLGHGLPVAVGLGIGAHVDNKKYRIYCMLGDGECCEGSVWEAAMAAAQYKLGNLVGIVDRNMLSLDGPTEKLMKMEPFGDKWKAFGWNVIEIDGNDMAQIVDALDSLPDVDSEIPTMIVSRTVKGKGIDFMENNPAWHGGMVSDEDLVKCYEMLDAKYAGKEN